MVSHRVVLSRAQEEEELVAQATASPHEARKRRSTYQASAAFVEAAAEAEGRYVLCVHLKH